MLAHSGRMFSKGVGVMIERSMVPSMVVAALGITLRPYHVKESSEIARGGPSKGGASRFETCAAAAASPPLHLLHIRVGPARKGAPAHMCVGYMLREM